MIIKVTAEHIAKGSQYHGGDCPVTRAIRDYFGEEIDHVHTTAFEADIYFRDREKVYHCPLPKVAQTFIADLRDTRDLEPFEFELEVS